MNKKKRLVFRTVILLLLGGAIAYVLYANLINKDSSKLEVGKKAPDFVLTDINGEKFQLSDYEGKGVILNFWATWCKPCEREMPYMNEQYDGFKAEGVEIAAVNIGESEVVVNQFVDKYDLKFPILIDESQEVVQAYGVDPLPTTFLINEEGIVEKVHLGEIPNEELLIEMMEEIKP